MSRELVQFGPPVLFVANIARSKTFYVDTLGLKLGFADETSAGVLLGDDMVLLVTVPSASDMLPGEDLATPSAQHPVGLFNIFVENVDETFESFKSRGVVFIVEPTDREWGRRTAHFKDPDGFIWEISQSIDWSVGS